MLFAIGHPEIPEAQEAIEIEAFEYEDILQGNFLDTYQNISYKHLTHLYFTDSQCDVPYMVKMDDDVDWNLGLFVDLLNYGGSEWKISKKYLQGKKIWCISWVRAPIRHEGKWKIPEHLLNEKTYPTYCAGFAYFLTKNALSELVKASRTVKFFWIDDIFVTGYIAKKAKIIHVNAFTIFHFEGHEHKNYVPIFHLQHKAETKESPVQALTTSSSVDNSTILE